MRKTAETLATISGPEGVEVSVELSRLYLVGICACVWALLVAFGPLGRAACPAVLPWSCCRVQQEGGRRGKDIAKATATGGEARKSVSAGEGAPNGKCANLAGADRCPQGAAPGTGARHGSIRPVCAAADPPRPSEKRLGYGPGPGLCGGPGWMDLTAERSQAEADRLYETTVVEAEIVKKVTPL